MRGKAAALPFLPPCSAGFLFKDTKITKKVLSARQTGVTGQDGCRALTPIHFPPFVWNQELFGFLFTCGVTLLDSFQDLLF